MRMYTKILIDFLLVCVGEMLQILCISVYTVLQLSQRTRFNPLKYSGVRRLHFKVFSARMSEIKNLG